MFFDPMIAHALLRESKSMYPVLQEASEFYHKGYELDQPAIAKGAHACSITSAGRYDYPCDSGSGHASRPVCVRQPRVWRRVQVMARG